MSRVRGRGNRDTELALAKLFRRHRITGWRRNQPVFGKPDFVFPKFRLAVFVDGCFWHGCPKHATKPKNNRAFWRRKFFANKVRDALVTRTLKRAGSCGVCQRSSTDKKKANGCPFAFRVLRFEFA
jgi:DNA mismatch endonuclease (patch repair protein)